MTVVSVRLSDEDVGKLNLLLKRGLYRSRNEAIRAILAEGLEKRLGEDEDITALFSELLKRSRNGKKPMANMDTNIILAQYSPYDKLNNKATLFLG